jgi:hypothetical protein
MMWRAGMEAEAYVYLVSCRVPRVMVAVAVGAGPASELQL